MKKYFIDTVAEKQNFSKGDVELILKEFFKQFKEYCRLMEPGEKFTLSGFMKVEAQARMKKTGRNPKTGEVHILPPAKNIKLKATPAFFHYVNADFVQEGDDRFEEED
jgi:nucleoid DNA-binding protein